jgi:predicted metal-dependent hydrolase
MTRCLIEFRPLCPLLVGILPASAKTAARVTSISVRPMTTKWASYSTTGRLTFDASLLELREELQDYVISHELLHFHAPNHGGLWKSLMRAHFGDYERLEGELRRLVAKRTLSNAAAVPRVGG